MRSSDLPAADAPRHASTLLVAGPFLMDRIHGALVAAHPGGNGLVVACVAARLGWPTTLLGRLAPDPVGQELARFALGCGVRLCRQAPEPGVPSKVAAIHVDDAGQWTTTGTTPAVYPYLAPPPDPRALAGVGALLLTGLGSLLRSCPEATAGWIAAARAGGTPLVLGLNRLAPPEGAALAGLLRADDTLFCNAAEAHTLLGVDPTDPAALAAALATAPGGDLVVSLGVDGALLRPAGGAVEHQPAVAAPAVNSVGAGDVLCAVTTVLRLGGLPLGEAVAGGQRAAGASVRDVRWWGWLEDEGVLVSLRVGGGR